MEIIIATDIKTELWNSIIETLREDGWKVTSKYYGFDAGIDDDYWVLKKDGNKIEFGWTNWFEGEIKAEKSLLQKIETKHNVKFTYGDPTSLKPAVIATYKLQSLPLWIVNKMNVFKRKL